MLTIQWQRRNSRSRPSLWDRRSRCSARPHGALQGSPNSIGFGARGFPRPKSAEGLPSRKTPLWARHIASSFRHGHPRFNRDQQNRNLGLDPPRRLRPCGDCRIRGAPWRHWPQRATALRRKLLRSPASMQERMPQPTRSNSALVTPAAGHSANPVPSGSGFVTIASRRINLTAKRIAWLPISPGVHPSGETLRPWHEMGLALDLCGLGRGAFT